MIARPSEETLKKETRDAVRRMRHRTMMKTGKKVRLKDFQGIRKGLKN